MIDTATFGSHDAIASLSRYTGASSSVTTLGTVPLKSNRTYIFICTGVGWAANTQVDFRVYNPGGLLIADTISIGAGITGRYQCTPGVAIYKPTTDFIATVNAQVFQGQNDNTCTAKVYEIIM